MKYILMPHLGLLNKDGKAFLTKKTETCALRGEAYKARWQEAAPRPSNGQGKNVAAVGVCSIKLYAQSAQSTPQKYYLYTHKLHALPVISVFLG
jgi:hypothetical protein